MSNCVYILKSDKLNRFYIGFTQDFEVRMMFHNNMKKGKYTSKADDWELFLLIECMTKSQGLAIEKHIKKMKSKVYIKNLKHYPDMAEKLKNRYL